MLLTNTKHLFEFHQVGCKLLLRKGRTHRGEDSWWLGVRSEEILVANSLDHRQQNHDHLDSAARNLLAPGLMALHCLQPINHQKNFRGKLRQNDTNRETDLFQTMKRPPIPMKLNSIENASNSKNSTKTQTTQPWIQVRPSSLRNTKQKLHSPRKPWYRIDFKAFRGSIPTFIQKNSRWDSENQTTMRNPWQKFNRVTIIQ